jgi:transposase-like protein
MGKKNQERRVYAREFKAGAADMVWRREKPIAQAAGDLGIGGAVSRRRGGLAALSRTRTASGRGAGPAAEGSQSTWGRGVKLHFTRNPKKSGRTLVRVIFVQGEPQ